MPCFKEPTAPEGMIGPRVTQLSKLLRREFNKASAEQGLFSGQQDIIIYIIENSGTTLSELAKKLGVSAATASVSVKRMEKAGFVTKVADENDARITRLYPTEKAYDAPEKIKAHMDSLEEVLGMGMTEDEKIQLSSLLQTAIDYMNNRGENNG